VSKVGAGEWHWTEQKQAGCNRLLTAVITVDCSRGLRASDMNGVEETTGKRSYLSEICFYFPIFIICT